MKASKYVPFTRFEPQGKYYWELWSGAGNLRGCFDTKEQLFDSIAEYIETYGSKAIKWILEDFACRCLSSGRESKQPQVVLGEQMLREAFKYG